MGADISEILLFGRKVAAEGLLDPFRKTAKDVIEDGAVKRFFVLEVVIEQGLVDLSGAGDGIGTGTGDTFMGKLADSGLQDGGAGFKGAATGTETRFASEQNSLLINQLVRL